MADAYHNERGVLDRACMGCCNAFGEPMRALQVVWVLGVLGMVACLLQAYNSLNLAWLLGAWITGISSIFLIHVDNIEHKEQELRK